MNRKPHVAVVGATNIDLIAWPKDSYIPHDSCDGNINLTCGGVARNISHNLVLLGCDVSLVTVFGDDELAPYVRENCEKLGFDISRAATISGAGSSMYVNINDEKGEMISAISDTKILDCITPEFMEERMDLLNSCDAVVFDTNLSTDTIAYIMDHCTAPLFGDTVSTAKSPRLFDALACGKRHLHTLKMNRLEAQVLTGVDADYDAAAAILMKNGVEHIYITLGSRGMYYRDANGKRFVPCEKVPVLNATGAGDAFISAIVFAFCKGLDTNSTIKCAQRAAALAVQHIEVVTPEMNAKYVLGE
ncbi:MAG: MarR family transcriptional regulator [Muribaculaceae bacterium]|nr:MarR family transcriptional regulator [Muribaculaceae bacterium]